MGSLSRSSKWSANAKQTHVRNVATRDIRIRLSQRDAKSVEGLGLYLIPKTKPIPSEPKANLICYIVYEDDRVGLR